MKLEIVETKYPRKANEYAVRVLSEDGGYIFCARPYTPYRAECELIVKAFEALLATPTGEAEILRTAKELP